VPSTFPPPSDAPSPTDRLLTQSQPVPNTSSADSALATRPAAPRTCAHCGLPVPTNWLAQHPDQADLSQPAFCCQGCQVAHALITDSGLGAFYDLPYQHPALPEYSAEKLQRYSWFDREDFQQRYVQRAESGLCSVQLSLSGIHCAACVWLLEKLPQLVAGVLETQVDWAGSKLRVRWQPEQVSLSRIAAVIASLGYTPYPLQRDKLDQLQLLANRRQLIHLAVAGALAGNNMLVALALYLGEFAGMAPAIEQLLRFASGLLGIISLVWPGRVFLVGAISALRTRTPHMDLPIALGLSIGTVWGTLNTLRGDGEVYFDSISVLVFFLLLGRFIQNRQQRSAAAAISLLSNLTPRWTRLLKGDAFEVAPSDCLQAGDRVEVLAGQLIPADGRVTVGRSAVDEAILTGESIPVSKQAGDEVSGGSLNLQGSLQVELSAVGTDSRLGKIVQLVEDASRKKPHIVQWADAIGGVFVVTVLVLAMATAVAWGVIDSPRIGIERAVALLIVACPCALALATPLAVSVGLVRAAREKILIKGGDVLQALHRPGTLWLDKTGTLTQGQLRVLRWQGDRRLLPAIAAIQSQSSHPVAIAMARFAVSELGPATSDDASLPAAHQVDQSPLGGIRGEVNRSVWILGTARFLESQQVEIGASWIEQSQTWLADGLSPVFVAVDGQVAGMAGVGDPLCDDAPAAIASLQRKGWKIGILSGDHQQIVDQVARQLGIAAELAIGGLLPEDKVRWVQQSVSGRLTGSGPADDSTASAAASTGTADGRGPAVVMVGDGVNDSAALAAATVGVAAHGGAQSSLAAAPVYLAGQGLDRLVRLFELSRATMRTIVLNLGASLSYNVVAVVLAAFGWISPLVAAILMPISSLTVVGISLLSPARSSQLDGRQAEPNPLEKQR
jgi:P-type Cu2+ transporter